MTGGKRKKPVNTEYLQALIANERHFVGMTGRELGFETLAGGGFYF
jgi:hypothetical protein